MRPGARGRGCGPVQEGEGAAQCRRERVWPNAGGGVYGYKCPCACQSPNLLPFPLLGLIACYGKGNRLGDWLLGLLACYGKGNRLGDWLLGLLACYGKGNRLGD